MIGILKMAGIAALMTIVAYGIGRLQGYNAGWDVGYEKKAAEVKAAADKINAENKSLKKAVAEAIRKDQDRAEKMRKISSANDMQCVVTKEYAERFKQ